jgi:nucleoside-diphosphate-sugar epimerase
MAQKTHVLITGGAGYLGSVAAPALLNAGYKVTVLDSFMFEETTLAACCADPDFDVIKGDARSEDVLRPLMKSADVIIPLAALVGAPMCNQDRGAAVSTNFEAVRTLSQMASKDQRIVMPITNSGYGVGEAGKMCTEDSPLNPISLYGRTKVDAEKVVLDRGNAISFRLATVFGMSPRMRLDLLVNDFVYRAVNDSALVLFEAHFKRNYIHVRDVARAFLHGIENFETMRDLPYNVGLSEANLSKAELCERIQKHVPRFVFLEAPIGEDPDKRDYIVSNDRLEGTGFKPAFGLDDGIVELIKGYRMLRKTTHGNV